MEYIEKNWALFFLLVYCHEESALEELLNLKKHIARDGEVDSELIQELYMTCRVFLSKNSNQRSWTLKKDFQVPSDFDSGAWLEYRLKTSARIFLMTSLYYIAQVPESLLANSLDMTQGQLRYRLNQSLQSFGQILLKEIAS